MAKNKPKLKLKPRAWEPVEWLISKLTVVFWRLCTLKEPGNPNVLLFFDLLQSVIQLSLPELRVTEGSILGEAAVSP